MSDHSFAHAILEVGSRTPETIERERCQKNVSHRVVLNGLMEDATDALDEALAGNPDFRAYIAKKFTQYPEVYKVQATPSRRGMPISVLADNAGSATAGAIYIVEGAEKLYIDMFKYVAMNRDGPLVVMRPVEVSDGLERKLSSISTPYALMIACLEVLGPPE